MKEGEQSAVVYYPLKYELLVQESGSWRLPTKNYQRLNLMEKATGVEPFKLLLKLLVRAFSPHRKSCDIPLSVTRQTPFSLLVFFYTEKKRILTDL